MCKAKLTEEPNQFPYRQILKGKSNKKPDEALTCRRTNSMYLIVELASKSGMRGNKKVARSNYGNIIHRGERTLRGNRNVPVESRYTKERSTLAFVYYEEDLTFCTKE
jgi:hypothetical protein